MSRPYIRSLSINYPEIGSIECNEFSENANVIFGKNEAGKSRVRDFIEWVMFASSSEISELKTAATKKAFSHLDPAISGSANIIIDGENVKISQKMLEGTTQANSDSFRITPTNVSQILTDGLSRSHYNNIFSLSLDELTRTESNKLITENELMNMFFGAAVTGSGISPPALLNSLTKQKDEMFSAAKQAKNKSINKILKEISEINSHIKQLRTDEKGLESADLEAEEMHEQLLAMDSKIEEISKEIASAQNILDNEEIYGRYEDLINEPKPEINSDLIARQMDINILSKSAKELIDQGDEREHERLVSVLDALKVEHITQEKELSATVSPENLSESAHTTKFEALVESEDRARTSHKIELKSIQDNVALYSADLGLLTQEVQRLQNSLNSIDSEKNKTQSPSSSDQTKSKSKIHFSRTPIAISIAGLVAGIASVIFNQPIGAIFGFVTFAAAIAFQLIPSSPEHLQTGAIAVSPNDLVAQQISGEIEKNASKMADYQTRIENLINEQVSLESDRSLDSQKFEVAITSAGFPNGESPHNISMYLSALKVYKQRGQRIAETESLVKAASNRLNSIYEKANSMRSYADNTKCQVTEPFKSLEEIQTWASSLFDFAQENATLEENLHKRDIELRELEKKLTSSFNSLENARTLFAEVNINELDSKCIQLIQDKDELRQKRIEIDHEIVRRSEQRNIASNSTSIADANQHLIRLTEELKILHHQYRGLYVAHSCVANALETFLHENQPELLRVASSMLYSITSGQWNEISVAQSESAKNSDPIINVSGQRAPHGLSITQLSRGTREQLYLCLRLALMETSLRGKQIPALFDDIAVNSDRARFESLAPEIGKIGQHRQVIYFTCHETTRDILANHAGARVINI